MKTSLHKIAHRKIRRSLKGHALVAGETGYTQPWWPEQNRSSEIRQTVTSDWVPSWLPPIKNPAYAPWSINTNVSGKKLNLLAFNVLLILKTEHQFNTSV